MATRTSDRIKVTRTLAQLDVSAAPEPYRLGLPGNKVVTFPDPGEMAWDEAEAFVTDMTSPTTSVTDVLRRWLSEDDFEALKESKMTLRQMIALTEDVVRHYGDIFGGPGEG